jgi:hypothetical protein
MVVILEKPVAFVVKIAKISRTADPIGRLIRLPLAPIRPCFGKVPPPPLRVNLNHLFRSI